MRGFTWWLVVVGVVIAAGILVPYGFLAGGAPSLDIMIFWCLFGVAVVGLIVIGVARWRL
ncbi:hypothetical protein SAMN04490248_1324 [Salinihabitans flavidus]|uniref:Uncharacterized protein n=1 Tax=Salinihabitans flavidus TaxID=569882 RepID=A0A1H8VPZ0_9RHOB|nr:hypothetical protein [Salinihabitans flavidus]SEP17267.1 hypothetical protein SAMN04490248_1324 [Salinihabitans flavidus]